MASKCKREQGSEGAQGPESHCANPSTLSQVVCGLCNGVKGPIRLPKQSTYYDLFDSTINPCGCQFREWVEGKRALVGGREDASGNFAISKDSIQFAPALGGSDGA